MTTNESKDYIKYLETVGKVKISSISKGYKVNFSTKLLSLTKEGYSIVNAVSKLKDCVEHNKEFI